MGVPTVTAARILKGQLKGQSGEETQLEMDKFPFVSLAKVCFSYYIIHILSNNVLIVASINASPTKACDYDQGHIVCSVILCIILHI